MRIPMAAVLTRRRAAASASLAPAVSRFSSAACVICLRLARPAAPDFGLRGGMPRRRALLARR